MGSGCPENKKKHLEGGLVKAESNVNDLASIILAKFLNDYKRKA